MIKTEMTDEEWNTNVFSHRIGVVDDCYRCVVCEIGSWNAWREPCPGW